MDAIYRLGFDSDVQLLGWIKAITARSAKKYVSSAIEFEELLSVALLAFSETLPAYDATRQASFRAYCAIRIRGAILDVIRKKFYRNNTPTERVSVEVLEFYGKEIASETRTAEESLLHRERVVALNRHIKKLSNTQRQILIDYFVHEKSQQEIATRFKKQTRSFACKNIQKSCEKLKQYFLAADKL